MLAAVLRWMRVFWRELEWNIDEFRELRFCKKLHLSDCTAKIESISRNFRYLAVHNVLLLSISLFSHAMRSFSKVEERFGNILWFKLQAWRRKYLRTDAVPAAIFNRDILAYWALAFARWTAFASTAETLLKLLASVGAKIWLWLVVL